MLRILCDVCRPGDGAWFQYARFGFNYRQTGFRFFGSRGSSCSGLGVPGLRRTEDLFFPPMLQRDTEGARHRGGTRRKKDLLEWLFRSRMCAAAKARRNCQPFTGQLKLCRSMTSFPEPSHSEVFRSLRSQAYLQSGSASTCGAPAIPLAGGLGRGRLRRRCGRCAGWAWAARGMRREVRSGTRTLW